MMASTELHSFADNLSGYLEGVGNRQFPSFDVSVPLDTLSTTEMEKAYRGVASPQVKGAIQLARDTLAAQTRARDLRRMTHLDYIASFDASIPFRESQLARQAKAYEGRRFPWQ